jgi:hypothetical protein
VERAGEGGVRVIWKVGRLIWIVNSDGISMTVRQERAPVLVYGSVVPCHMFTVEIAGDDYRVVLHRLYGDHRLCSGGLYKPL